MKKKKLTPKRKKKYYKGRRLNGTYPGCTAETLGKHYKPNAARKRKLTAKQKKSLSKGRKVLSYLRTGRQISEPKEPLIIKEGFFMASKGKAKKARKTGRRYGFEGFEGKRKRASRRYGFEGFEGKKRRSKKRGKYLHGGLDGFSPAMLGLDLAGLLAGAIGASFAANIMPIKNLKIKALIPLLAGIAIVSFPKISKNRFFNRAGLGALSIGGVALTRQLLPALPLLSGMEDAEGIAAAIDSLPDEEKAILGIMPTSETAGLIEDRTDGEETDTYGELAADGEDGEDGEFIPEPAPLSPATMGI